ncbi:MAG: type I DNA topoisomerase, partial [Crocinitomicaceae bacterium]
MSKNLVIVESPAKAKTIESYLGKEYVVKSSFGHIRDLGKKGLSINIDQNFEPEYEVSVDKKQVVSDLKKCVKQAETVWLATDEDREGEAISWHLFETLELDEKNTKRITFNEITKTAVTKAIQNPRKINKALVDAQQARRVLDRIVGFELSPVLWRKVKPNLSAGRVQSVAVRLIVEREDEIRQFTVESSFKTYGKFQSNTTEFKAELTTPFDDESQAKSFLEGLTHAVFNVANLETKPGKKSASPPFTTSTLQQEASVKLGFNVARTMVLAQRLYEAGHITYMRTDSTNLSETAMVGSNQEIIQRYGEKYASPTKYATKNANAQEAHEAIRPTNFQNESIDGERDEQRLYELIWRRTMASQMAPAVLEKTTISIANDQNK